MANEEKSFRTRAEKVAQELSDPDFGLASGHSYLYDHPEFPATENAEGDKGEGDHDKENID